MKPVRVPFTSLQISFNSFRNGPPTRLQWAGLLLFLACTVLFTAGCSVNWISEVQGMLPLLGAAAVSFVSLLTAFGTKISPTLLTTITTWQLKLQGDLSNLSSLIAAYNDAPADQKATTLEQVQTIASEIQGDFDTILPELQISDPASLAKATAIFNALMVQFKAIVAVIPAIEGDEASAKAAVKAGKLPLNAEQFASHFNQIVAHGTGDSETDAMLAAHPALVAPARS